MVFKDFKLYGLTNVWWKLLGGASVSIFANTIASSSPLALSIISGDQR